MLTTHERTNNVKVVVALVPNDGGRYGHNYNHKPTAVLESDILMMFDEYCRSQEIGSSVFEVAEDGDSRRIIQQHDVDGTYVIQPDNHVETTICFSTEEDAAFGLLDKNLSARVRCD